MLGGCNYLIGLVHNSMYSIVNHDKQKGQKAHVLSVFNVGISGAPKLSSMLYLQRVPIIPPVYLPLQLFWLMVPKDLRLGLQLHPMMAGAMMAFSSVSVVSSSFLLRRWVSNASWLNRIGLLRMCRWLMFFMPTLTVNVKRAVCAKRALRYDVRQCVPTP